MEASEFATTPEEDWAKVDDIMAAIMAKANEMQGLDMGQDMGDMEFDEPAHPTLGMSSDFSLKTLRSGDEISSSLKGKVVVLDFWATWCGPCVAGLPTMRR